MGKKSRKKGAEKSARKDKLQSRREQQIGQRNRANPDGDDGDNANRFSNPTEREYFVGDRVWFIDNGMDENTLYRIFEQGNPNTYRGVVKGILPEGALGVVSLKSIIDGNEHVISFVAKDRVFPDFQDFTLRFNVGDKVVYRSGSWCTAKVSYLWPIHCINTKRYDNAGATFPPYQCKEDFYTSKLTQVMVAPEDDDGSIKLRPTSFRFKLGDSVVVNPLKAEQIGGRSATKLAKCTTWLSGEVTAVDVSKAETNYAVYECSLSLPGNTWIGID